MRVLVSLVLAVTSLAHSGHRDDALVPAGVINDALRAGPFVYLAEADASVERYVTAVRDRFQPGAALHVGQASVAESFAGRSLIVYGTPSHPWLVKYQDRLPFGVEDGAFVVAGRRFEGEDLRLILAMRHPEDPDRRALLYVAHDARHLADANNVHHGPTQWVVARGNQVLGKGAFPRTGPLTRAEVEADLDQLLALIRNVHPRAAEGLPPAVEEAARQARASLPEECDDLVAWANLSRVVAALGDGHSVVGAPDSGPGLPIAVRFLGERLVVVGSSVDEIQVGDVVVSIGGRGPAALQAAVGALYGSENEGWTRRLVEVALDGGGLLRLLGLVEDGRVAFVGWRGDQEVRAGLEPADEPVRARAGGGQLSPILDTEANLALLPLQSMNPSTANAGRFSEFLERVEQAGITRLAIDVRENGGGNSQAMLDLVGLLKQDGWTSFGATVRVSPESNAQGRTRGRPAVHEVEGRRQPANPDGFEGEVFVLTSPRTFSSGAWLPVLIQDNGLGRVVGEAPGNAPSRPGDALRFELPRTGFRVGLPFKDWIRPDPTRDPADELVPDVVIVPTVEDLVAGRDPLLDWLRAN